MSNFNTLELKVFVPSHDFAVSRQFYEDLGFTVAWANDDMAYIHYGNAKFLLQKFYVKDFAENLQMHLLVEDAQSWHERAQKAATKHGVSIGPLEQQPWNIKDFTLHDPAGVLWRIGQATS